MYKTAFGTQRQQLLEWLKTTWLPDGPPICIVEGFPGVGKTALAGDLCDVTKTLGRLQICFEEVTNRPAPSLTDLFLDLASNLTGHCNQPDMETAQGQHDVSMLDVERIHFAEWQQDMTATGGPGRLSARRSNARTHLQRAQACLLRPRRPLPDFCAEVPSRHAAMSRLARALSSLPLEP